jgi:hypothetical protein
MSDAPFEKKDRALPGFPIEVRSSLCKVRFRCSQGSLKHWIHRQIRLRDRE